MKTLILGRLITLFVLMFGLILPTTYVAAADISLSTFQKFTGQGDDLSGYSVASAGDVNGDGYNDFLVGAYGNDSSTGAVYLIYGTDSILTSADLSTAVKFTGESPNDFAGYSVASAGDVNGDGYDDILIGAKGDDTIGTNAGAVYLIYGGSRLSSYGGSLSGAVKFTGEKASDNAGFSVASAGDVDGDNIDDILIGAPYSNSLLHTGAAYVIYGKPIHLTSANLSTAVKFSGTLLNDNAGFSVAGAGDVDGDNIDDILIGSPYNGFSDAGAAYLVYGQTSFTSSKLLLSTLVTASEAVKFTGASPDDSAGYSVASAGDVNNDGNDDILIGAPYNDDAGTDAGAAYLVYGQTSFSGYTLSSDAIEFTGETINDNAGFSVASAGDVNNDNYNDILIGAPLQYFTAGAVYFIYGQEADLSSASLSTSAAMFVGQESGDSAGNSVASAGDVNGDGYADILIGAPYALSDTTGADAGAAYLGYLYVDLDGDGLTGSSILTSGTDTNDNDFDNDGSEIGTDCDDGDASISANQTYYKDNDNDGLGDPATSTSICSYTVPTGYVTNSSDTNDNDYDNDGSVTGTDCNDADSTISTNQTYYKDNDNDGLGDPANSTSICSYTVPTGYVSNKNDANDNDYDNDGSVTGTDCNDSDATIHDNQTYYRDEDNNGLGDPNDTISVCSLTAPAGYVANDDDTNISTQSIGAVAYVVGTKTGPGMVKLYDSNDVLIRQWLAFPKSGVIARLVNINGTKYVLAVKKKSGSTLHMYNINGTLLDVQKIHTKLHWRQPAVGNLNNAASTEEFVISSHGHNTLYFRAYSYDTSSNAFHLLKRTSYHYVGGTYRVEIKNKVAQIKVNGIGKTVFNWKPF